MIGIKSLPEALDEIDRLTAERDEARLRIVYGFYRTSASQPRHFRDYDTREEAERFREEYLSYGMECSEIIKTDAGTLWDEERDEIVRQRNQTRDELAAARKQLAHVRATLDEHRGGFAHDVVCTKGLRAGFASGVLGCNCGTDDGLAALDAALAVSP